MSELVRTEQEHNATEVQTKDSQMPQVSDTGDQDADAVPPPSKRLRLSSTNYTPRLVLEPVERIQHAQHSADPAVQFLSTSTASDLAAKQLKALKELYAIYQVEHKEVLEELRTTHQAFLASGHCMLTEGAEPLHPVASSCDPSAASITDILRAYRARQQILQQPEPAAPDSPSQGPTPQRRREAVPGSSEASLGNWIAHSTAPQSTGTPQSGLRQVSAAATHAIGLTPVREEPCQPSTQEETGQGKDGTVEQPVAKVGSGDPAGAQNGSATHTQDTTKPSSANAAGKPPSPVHQGNTSGGDNANGDSSAAGEGAAETTAAAASAAPMEVDQSDAAALQPTAAEPAREGKASEVSAAAAAAAAAAAVTTPQRGKLHDEGASDCPAGTGSVKRATPLVQRLLVARALAADKTGEQHEDVGSFSEAEEALMAVVGTAPASKEAVSQPAEDQQQQQPPSGRARFAGCGLDKLLQLEALASATSEQELEEAGALASLVTPAGRFLIRQATVLLGRNTETKGEVDVDLSLIESTAKVSRRQAYLTLRPDGLWSLTNAGRQVVVVDGLPVGQLQTVSMQHLSLLEIGSIRLVLMVNSAAVERVLRRTVRAAV